MAAGAGFQEGVTAWLAVHLLAEDHAPPLPSLEVTLRIASIACETEQPIDDINARSNVGVTIYIQAKRAVRQLVDRDGSDFTDFIEQAVDQHMALRTVGSDTPARYVLATSPDAARKVRRELRDILERFRSSAHDTAIDSFGNTADERSALTTTASIIRRMLSDRGEQPTDEVVREVLERIVVWELELDGSARSNAIGLLAAAVVPNSTVGAQAWRTLENRALKAAEDHETLDLHGWRRALRMDGIQLRAIPSLEPDIGRVRAHSSRALADLNRHRLLRVGGGDLSVDREVTAVAHRLVRDGPLLLVGDAGSGKSAVLSGLAGLLQGDGADVVILDAEALASGSLGELSRELALDHDLGEILEAWPGSERGYLLVDGLDETRGRPGVATLRRLVARVAVSGSWVPVVAVRRFDLRYSSEIRRIFAGMHGESSWTDSEFVDTRHVVVGDLSDPELDQLRLHSASLVAMAKTDGVGPLLRRPIHLQLAADLLSRGGSEVDLARLRTQLELLDLYWARLVEEPVAGRASREAVLEAAARLGVSDRLLAFPRTALDAVDADATTTLLGLGTLVEGEFQPGAGRPVRFLHGLVADYAIARLVLRPAGAAEALLVDDPVNALFLRRPLELWLTGLWQSGGSREAFWTLALDLCARNDVPEIAKLVAPSIAGQSWTETEDLDPLLAALSDPRRAHALAVLRHLVASLTAPPNSPIAGAEAVPWSRLAVILTVELAEDLVFPVRLLVTLLADARSELTHTQADELGKAARQLLSWLWDHDSSDMVAARFAIRAVFASFESDSLAAETLLRRGLCREHVRNRGYEELRHYADHVENLAGAPGLVVALYTAAFAFDDAGGTGPGVMLGGPVLSLQSDRRQEFQMARYGLASVFGGLMQRAPEVATAALLRVLRASAQMRRDHYIPGPYATFTTEGLDSRVRDEWSAYKVAWLMSHDDEATLIAAWTSGLATLAVGGDPRLGSSLAVFLANNRTFAGWQILVDAATHDERLIPTIVRVIASAYPVLSAAALREPLCRLAAAARLQASLVTEFRAGIESPIVAVEARVALTACLDGTTSPIPADEEEDGDVAPMTLAQARATPISSRQILDDWLNAEHDEHGPIPLAVQANFATVAGSLGPHDSANEEDWYLASRVAERLSRIGQDCHTKAGQLVATVLLRVLASAATYDGAWGGDEEVASIPSHACVLGATEGIVGLYAAGLCDDLLPATTIRTIVDHPLPWARMALARSSGRLFARDPELAWSTLDRLAGDPVARVAADAVWMATRFRRRDPDLAKALLTHAIEEHGTRSKLVGAAVMSLGGTLFIDGVEEPERFISILEDAERIFDAASLLHGMRPSIMSPVDDDPAQAEAHHAAMQILRAVSSVAVRRYDEAAPRWEEAGDEDARERARDAIQALDAVVSETYFASGAYRGGDDKNRPTAEQMALLFDETAGDLRELLRHLPARSIHHVVEIAAANANARPTEAFLLIGDAVRAARAVGYETDSLAKDLVLGIVRTYMADRSELFQGSTESASAMQAALVTILDSFVAVGWPEARSMAYHLHEVLQ